MCVEKEPPCGECRLTFVAGPVDQGVPFHAKSTRGARSSAADGLRAALECWEVVPPNDSREMQFGARKGPPGERRCCIVSPADVQTKPKAKHQRAANSTLAPGKVAIYAAPTRVSTGVGVLSLEHAALTQCRGARGLCLERRVVMRCEFVYAMVLVALAACSGKSRPFGDAPAGAGGTEAAGSPEQSSSSLQPESGGSAVGVTPPVLEGAPPVDVLQPADTASEPSEVDSSMGTDSCPGCLVSDDCVAVGEVNSDNPCEVCDPTRDAAGWSSNDGATCDDGLFCTIDDACNDRSCSGAPRICEDGVACNGVSICVEDDDACSAGEGQCGVLQLCDAELDQCVSTCSGCVVGGVCIAAGALATNNPCLVCDPQQSATSLSALDGAPCGSGPTDCSAQDTCDAQGQCVPNHLPSGTLCGPLGAQCDAEDTCNGSGVCIRRVAPNGSLCEDGQFCTDGDRCQGGQCVPGAPRNCGQNRLCNETQDACVLDLGGPGEPCTTNADCASGGCTFWFIDSDGDGFGSGNAIGACGLVQPNIRLLPGQTLVLDGGDCCPSDPGSHPGFTPPVLLPPQTEPDACGSFDRDCSGRVENSLQTVLDALGGPIASCQAVPPSVCEATVERESQGSLTPGFTTWLGEVPLCGEFGTQIVCEFDGNFCTIRISGQLANSCR